MKATRIIWGASAGTAVLLTAILLSTAMAGDVVYRDTRRISLTGPQAAGYFLTYANAECPCNAAGVDHIRVDLCALKDGTKRYCHRCRCFGSGDIGDYLDAKDTAAAAGDRFVDAGIVQGGTDERWLVERRGMLTPAQAGAYFLAFANDRCGVAASKVTRILLNKLNGSYGAVCIGVNTASEAQVHAARVADATTDSDGTRTIEVIGRAE